MKRKGHITEGDVAVLLQRYSAKTVLALLQEVAKCANMKIDWNTLVRNTATGITNAREYQMLWRHLAYCAILPDKYEDGAQPFDDDSDLDFEIEPSPPVAAESLAEAAACVKVLEASGIPNNSGQPSHSIVEAPLTINIPSSTSVSDVHANNQQSTISTQGMNITVPVSIQKQPLPAVSSSEGIDGNVSTSSAQPMRKKRKLWTAEEDKELIAAVQKCGEGNWASILKGAFKHDRTASQLSQRWSLIRKRRVVPSQGNLGNTSTLSGTVDALQSAAQIVPVAGSTASGISVTATPCPTTAVTANTTGATTTAPCSSSILPMASGVSGISLTQTAPETGPENAASQLSQDQQGQEQGLLHGITTITSVKFRPKTKKHASNKASTGRLSSMPPPATTAGTASVSTPAKAAVSLPASSPSSGRYGNNPATQLGISEALGHVTSKTLNGPNPMVQAAAVAAGARIAPASAAASLLKAAQSGNVVHFGAGVVPLAKSGYSTQAGTVCGMTDTIRSSTGGISNSTRASSAGGISMRAPNVHYIRTGSVPSPPVYSGAMPSVQRLPASQPKGPTAKAATTSQLSSRTNLLLGTTLPAKQPLEGSSASQAQVLNQVNQVNCSPSITPVLTSRGKLKTQTGPSVIEASQTVQSDLRLKSPRDMNSPVPPTLAATADQQSTEQTASASPKASALPPAVEICSGVSSSLSASNSLCPVVGPCQLTDIPADINSIPVSPDNIIVNDKLTVQEGKIIELESKHSSSATSGSFQHQACSERSIPGENAAGFEGASVKAKIDAHQENNSKKNIEIQSMPGLMPVNSDHNVLSSAQNVLSDDPSIENGK